MTTLTKLILNIARSKAKTSLFCSKAYRAVISDPLLSVASITNVPIDNPLIIRLRRGNFLLLVVDLAKIPGNYRPIVLYNLIG